MLAKDSVATYQPLTGSAEEPAATGLHRPSR